MTLGSTIHATAPLEHLCVLVLLPADLRRARKLSIPQLRGCPLTYNEVLDAGQADICQTDKGQAALVAGAASSCFQPRPVPQADQEQSQGQVMRLGLDHQSTVLVLDPCAMQAPTEGGLEQIFESRTDSSHAGNPSDALKELVLRLESSCKEAQQSCEAPCGSLLARHGRAHLEQPESGGEDAGRKRASFLAEQTPTTPAGSQQQEMPLTTSVSARLEGHAANGCECGYLAHPTESWSDFDIETQLQEAVKREEAAGKAAEMAGKGTAAVQQTREDQLAQEVMEAKHQELQELGNFNGWREHLDLVTAGDLQSAAFQKQRVLVQESTLLCVRTRLLYSRLLERHALLCVGTSLARLSQKKQDLVDEGLCPQTGEAAERNFQQALQALWQKAQPTLLLEGLSRAREASQLELQYEACLDEARMEIAECLSLQREISNAYAWQHSNLGSDEELDKLQRCHLEMGIKYCMLTLISHRLRLQWATALRAQSECHLAEEEERMALVQVPWKPGMFLGHISRTCRQACLATHPAPPQPYGTGDTGLF
ncbi:hypothetical protein WJX84_005322 [Apatococcus fuscideae]|uniref:Uncharacterized protein n=1 Tax=Apatococcus fuscideae TaxID=2026836 RepID=A0AAW1T3F5_9CHLO